MRGPQLERVLGGRETLRNARLGGPDDAEKEGRWLPYFAVDQYGATLARWFGVAASDLGTVCPNLASFPSADLGFMG